MATEQAVSAVIVATRPLFKNDIDRVVFALHASFLSAGYILNATGAPAFTDDALTSTSSDEVGIESWNDFGDYYAFVYSLPEKVSKKVLVKCLVANDKLIIDALKEGTSDPHHLEVSSIGAFVGDSNATNYRLQYKNLGNLVDVVNKEILTKLSGSSIPCSSAEVNSSEKRGLRDDRNEPDVRVTEPPPLYDPYHPLGINVPPVYPGLGHDGLSPFSGSGIPLRGDFGSGGMLMGPNDPRFRGGIGGQPDFQFPFSPFMFACPSQHPDQQQLPTQLNNKKKAKATSSRSRERNPNWTVPEDEALCKSWIRISEDDVVGIDQQRLKLWDRVLTEFNATLEYESGRNSNGLMHRWSCLQANINKFSGYICSMERARAHVSGFNEEDIMIVAKKMYRQNEKHQFKWESCWKILKDTSKWYHHINKHRQEKQKTTPQRKRFGINLDDDDDSFDVQTPTFGQPTPGTTPSSSSYDKEDGPFNEDSRGLERPPGRSPAGRKSVKNARRKKDCALIDLFGEKFSNMRKDTLEELDEEAIRKKEGVEQKLTRRKASMEADRNRMILYQEQQEEKRLVQEQKKWEKDIMMMDPNLAPTKESKAWIIQQQKEIFRKISEVNIP